MKIIAKTNSGFLIEASDTEIKAVMGHERYAREDDTGKIEVGREIDVSESFRQLTEMRGSRKQLDTAAKTLREAADNIDAVKLPAVEPFHVKRTR